MTKKVNELHTELRSALQAPKTNAGWMEIKRLLRPLYPSLEDKTSRAKPELLAQVEEEVMPALEQALDRDWPARLRVAEIEEHPRIKQLSKVLHILFYGSSMKIFGAQHGLNYKTTALSKKQMGELMPHWTGGARLEGFILSYVDNHHLALVEALVKACGGTLRHLRWDNMSAPLQRTPYRFKLEELEAMMEIR